MRHNKVGRKLNRNASHRKALYRNLATCLFRYGSIHTTLPKAKEIRPYAEKLVTRAIDASLSDIRLIIRRLSDRKVAHHLINNIAPKLKDRPGGYIRIIKLGPRQGDGAEMAQIEIVSEEVENKKKQRKIRAEKKKVQKAGAESKEESSDSESNDEVPHVHDKTHPRVEQTKEHLSHGSKAQGSRRSSKPPEQSISKQSSVNRGTSTPKTPPPSSQEN